METTVYWALPLGRNPSGDFAARQEPNGLAELKKVGAMIHDVRLILRIGDQFRRGEEDRPNKLHLLRKLVKRARRHILTDKFSDSKINHLYGIGILAIPNKVVRFEIAMNHPPFV